MTPDDGDRFEDYSWVWVREIASDRGIGNYPASREALQWCIGELGPLRRDDGVTVTAVRAEPGWQPIYGTIA